MLIKYYQPVIDYLDAQFEAYLQEELKIKRSLVDYNDSRIHVCLYFIAPTGHSLKSLDLVTMKNIDRRVNIIPLIAKADALSKSDLQRFKSNIMSELDSNGIQIYQFPEDDEDAAQANTSVNGLLPFAVVGSMEEVKVGKRMVRGRHYPWGVLQVENENHCDFVKLRDLLLCTHMEDLKDQTHSHHYECYRSSRLQQLGFNDTGPDSKPVSFQEMYEAKRQEFHNQCQREEEELKQTFMQRVKEKELTFKDAEKELQDKFEHLRRIQQEETLKLEEERRKLEEQIIDFYKMKAASETSQAQVNTNVKKDKDRKK
ncbi:septin-14 [Microtus oregoni]|uniref:septin-14 n=1 Tax=Microtus oregoni TaxID=111838 RepID=UPI001BB24DDC|nr:septin-14 [Microtus oregoni]